MSRQALYFGVIFVLSFGFACVSPRGFDCQLPSIIFVLVDHFAFVYTLCPSVSRLFHFVISSPVQHDLIVCVFKPQNFPSSRTFIVGFPSFSVSFLSALFIVASWISCYRLGLFCVLLCCGLSLCLFAGSDRLIVFSPWTVAPRSCGLPLFEITDINPSSISILVCAPGSFTLLCLTPCHSKTEMQACNYQAFRTGGPQPNCKFLE